MKFSQKNFKALMLSGLLIGEAFANPCARLNCSCRDPRHLYCSGVSTISADALARSVVASQVESIDLRYRIFGMMFLAQIAQYFTGLKSVRVEGGICAHIIQYLDKFNYTIIHDCPLSDALEITATSSVETTYSVTRETESTTAVTVYGMSTGSTVTDATAHDMSTGSRDSPTLSLLEDITTVNHTETAIFYGNSSDTALSVARRDGDVGITMHADGSVTVLIPWIIALCLFAFVAVLAILYLCCCKRNPSRAISDPENPAVGHMEGAIAKIDASTAAVLLGSDGPSSAQPCTSGENCLAMVPLPADGATVSQAALALVETVDIGLQVSISGPVEGASQDTPDSQLPGNIGAIVHPTTTDIGLQVSLPSTCIDEEDSDHMDVSMQSLLTEESFITVSEIQDYLTPPRYLPPSASSPLPGSYISPPQPLDDISIITDDGAGPSHHLPMYVITEEGVDIEDLSNVTSDRSASLGADQYTETTTASRAPGYGRYDVRIAAVLADSTRERPPDATLAAKVGAKAIARGRKTPRFFR